MNGLKPVSPFSKACSQIAWSPVCDNQQCLCKRNSLLNETTPNIFLCVQTWHQKFQEGRNHKRSGKCGKCIFHFKFLITSLFLVEHEICIADKKYPEGKCDKRSCYNISNIIFYYSNQQYHQISCWQKFMSTTALDTYFKSLPILCQERMNFIFVFLKSP